MKKTIEKSDTGEQNLDRQTTRLDFIDVTKGLGVVLVVLSHIINQDSIVNAVIYSFHVPLFFVISGVFARPERDLKSYLCKNAKRLLLPFLIFFVIGLLVTLCVSGTENITVADLFSQFVYAQPTQINVGATWFLVSLFVTSLLFFVLYRLVLSKYNTIISIIVIGILGALAYYLPWAEEKIGVKVPFKIDVSLMALVFYTIGFLLKDIILSCSFCSKVWRKIIIILMSGGIVFVTTYFLNGLTNLSGGIYGSNLYFYVFAAFSGSIMIIVFGALLKRSMILSYIGKNSLIIFSLHTLLLIPFNALLNKYDINNSLFVSSIATVIIVLIMMGVCFCYNRLKRRIKSRITSKSK